MVQKKEKKEYVFSSEEEAFAKCQELWNTFVYYVESIKNKPTALAKRRARIASNELGKALYGYRRISLQDKGKVKRNF